MKDETILASLAIACICFLEAAWIIMGHNHSSLTLAIGAIGTCAGFKIGKMRNNQT